MRQKLLRLVSSDQPAAVVSKGMSDDWHDRVYVKNSPIHGLGMFARRTFATGETILVREERPVTAEHPLDAVKGESEHHCDWLEGDRQVYLGFPERHLNHSCDANSYVRFDGGPGVVVAVRPIHPNEEITNHYGVNLWNGEDWRCSCGSERCLGSVPGGFYRLPLEVQVELSPFLAGWFVEEHRSEYDAFLKAAGLDKEGG